MIPGLAALVLGSLAAAARSLALDDVALKCSRIAKPNVPEADILSIDTRIIINGTVSGNGQTLKQDVHGINVCEVNVTLSHRHADDKVWIQTWLPIQGWNNRWLALGGGAWLAGQGTVDLALPATRGYAASSTDGGLDGNPFTPAGWALDGNDAINSPLLENFAHRSIHDMAVVGKAVAASFYQRRVAYSYWSSCSTGGRQGMVAAQRYPRDFDGILAGAPAIYWTQYVVAELWPQVVMRESGHYPLPCELDTIVKRAVEACDELDGVRDNIITDPDACAFDPFTLVGTRALCDGDSTNTTISSATASIVRKIWDGPRNADGSRLWPGLLIGASLSPLAGTQLTNGTNGPMPFFLAQQWVQYFVKQNASFDVGTLTSAEFESVLMDSKNRFDAIIGSSNPDLSAFKKGGGKLLAWHGLADQLIFPQDTVQYLNEVEHFLGGGNATNSFFRLFLAPGVDHCAYSSGQAFAVGAAPVDPLAALISWVEDGNAPVALDGESGPTATPHFTRKICKYPLKPKYVGCGSKTLAKNFVCV
ncbi:hypothetical protein V2A60_002327 [Cordyceps javanica]